MVLPQEGPLARFRLDDITVAQQDQAEASVVFDLIALRYETTSLAIAANQPFSAWGKVFPDQAVTVAANDRFVYPATILAMNGESYLGRAVAERRSARPEAGATTSSVNLETKTTDTIKQDNAN